MAMIPPTTTPVFTTKSDIKVWIDQSKDEEKFQNQFLKMDTILCPGGPVFNRTKKIWGSNNIKLVLLIYDKEVETTEFGNRVKTFMN